MRLWKDEIAGKIQQCSSIFGERFPQALMRKLTSEPQRPLCLHRHSLCLSPGSPSSCLTLYKSSAKTLPASRSPLPSHFSQAEARLLSLNPRPVPLSPSPRPPCLTAHPHSRTQTRFSEAPRQASRELERKPNSPCTHPQVFGCRGLESLKLNNRE